MAAVCSGLHHRYSRCCPILREKLCIRKTNTDINANPKDSKDHPEGVWTLPPSYRLKDKDREKYAAIGESDRFTLRFVKP